MQLKYKLVIQIIKTVNMLKLLINVRTYVTTTLIYVRSRLAIIT